MPGETLNEPTDGAVPRFETVRRSPRLISERQMR